jgi:hypothetical protein
VTRRVLAYRIVTQQKTGCSRSQVTKLLKTDLNISKAHIRACDAEHPHFYINLQKLRFIRQKIISRSWALCLKVSSPVALPFGFFPIQTKSCFRYSYTQIGRNLRGYNLTEGGYYFAIDEYLTTALGNIYTNGTWMLTLRVIIQKYKLQ